MEDDILIKFRQISKIYKENFKSSEIQEHNQNYLHHLYDELNSWRSNINDRMRNLVDNKIEEIKQLYEQYCQEFNEKYARIDEQIENNNLSLDLKDQIENFNIYCQSNTIEKRIHLYTSSYTNEQLAEKIQLEYILYRDLPPATAIVPLPSVVKEDNGSARHSRTSSESVPPSLIKVDKEPIRHVAKHVYSKSGLVVKQLEDPFKEEPFVAQNRVTTSANTNERRTSATRIYIGRHNITAPVLVDTNREVDIGTERLTEYSIDILMGSQGQQQQPSYIIPINADKENELVRAYKFLVKQKTDYQQIPASSSSNQEYELNVDQIFNFEQFDSTNYSTIMLLECETAYNCLSSSTKRNELLIYNSKLNILIILQHETLHQCRHRFYLDWRQDYSSHISDITYCSNNDQYLISTWDTSHIYLFNRDSLTITDLGKLSNDLNLHRIHCYQQTIYCILGNKYLLEFELDQTYSNIKFIQKIKLFNPIIPSLDTAYQLLDITCDKNHLVIIYANEHDEIHLQSIHRQTLELHCDLLLDEKHHIERVYIRIEPTYSNGIFIYLNGLQQHLKAIDFVNYDRKEVRSMIRRQKRPTNLCFLKDGRLVVLYEDPYFLSVHDLNKHQELD